MNHWFYIRVGLVVLSTLSALLEPIENIINIGWEFVAVALAMFPLIAIIGRACLFLIPKLKNSFNEPKWKNNPFDFSRPEEFFHLGGYVLIFSGAGTVSKIIASSQSVTPTHIATIALGIGILVGLRILIFNKIGKIKSAI